MKLPQRLNQRSIDEFYDAGFTVVPDVLDPDDLTIVSHAFDRLQARANELVETCMDRNSQFVLSAAKEAQNGDGVMIHRIVWCGGAEPELERLGRSAAITELAADILGDTDMVQLINQAHFKLPGDGVRFDWHQDCLHRRYGTDEWRDTNGRGSFVEVIVAIDPMTEENGAIEVVPYSCKQGALPVDPATRTLMPDSFDPKDAITVTLAPGSALLLGPYTIHGSGPNESNRPRRAFLNGFASPGANERMYPGCGKGHPLTLC
jgi:ectoine hydroxylase-related dioxygenase (phytanoyl-CoA dioxygenase family)